MTKLIQERLVLYTVGQNELLETIDELISSGSRCNVVTNLTEIRDPNMVGDSVATWLIVFTPKSSGIVKANAKS